MAQDKQTLSNLIEKIIVSGSLEKSDQKVINATAKISSLDYKDINAMNKLTQLIQSGRVKVN